jgi:hypothetical protein
MSRQAQLSSPSSLSSPRGHIIPYSLPHGILNFQFSIRVSLKPHHTVITGITEAIFYLRPAYVFTSSH